MLKTRADEQIEIEKYDDALASGRKAVELAPQSGLAWSVLAIAMTFHPDTTWDDTVAAANRSIELDEASAARAYCALGLLDWWNGYFDDAEEELREAIRLEPAFFQAHDVLGSVLSEAGRGEEAIAELREAVRLAPNRFSAKFDLAAVLADSNYIDEATRVNMESLELARTDSDRADVYNNAAYNHVWSDRPFEAVAAAQEGIRLDPEDPVVNESLGALLSLYGDPELAVPYLRAALAEEYPLVSAQPTWAYNLAIRGRTDEARAELKACGLDLIESWANVDALHIAGLAYHELGQPIVTTRIFRRALERWPAHPWSDEWQAYVDERSGG